MSEERFDTAIAAFEPRLPVAVALSGGADSTALLIACTRRWPTGVVALHVHHGLQAAADDFARHCASLCAELGVRLRSTAVDARHAPGESPEAAARRARYAALARLAGGDAAMPALEVALAHHADDQVETLLIALSRGAGLPGLSAMPRRMERHGVVFHRPLLDVPGAVLRDWLLARRHGWIDDPSNRDERFVRNRIRSRLMAPLADAFPHFRAAFARSAAHAAQAQRLLAELACSDLGSIGEPPTIAGLQRLSRDRQGNVLRYWLAERHRCGPSTAQLEALLDQVEACRTRGHAIRLKLGAGLLVREGEHLHWYNAAPPS